LFDPAAVRRSKQKKLIEINPQEKLSPGSQRIHGVIGLLRYWHLSDL